MTHRAQGTFEIQFTPQTSSNGDVDPLLGRMSFSKQLHGDLEGTSVGEMLTARTAVPESAGYVAIERVRGVLSGRSGSFVLQHSSTMSGSGQRQHITVVPDSGTGELVGLTGSLTITMIDDQHHYTFEYSFAPAS